MTAHQIFLSDAEDAALTLAAEANNCTPEEWLTACILMDLTMHRHLDARLPERRIRQVRELHPTERGVRAL